MCGIVGYVGNQDANDVLLTGLRKLEYRGYDSCGIVTINSDKFSVTKTTNRIDNLSLLLKDAKSSHIRIRAYTLGYTWWCNRSQCSSTFK